MATDILPDPVNKITAAGDADNVNGKAGPGFAKIKFRSSYQTQVSRTISGRGVTASPGFHLWEFDINYNPITREEFEPVSSFLEERNGRLKPFYVILPQHSKPQDATLAGTIVTSGSVAAGATVINFSGKTAGTFSKGDFINFTDPNNAFHTKAYKVVSIPSSSSIKVSPPLSRSVSASSVIVYNNPKFRVIQKGDAIEYDLETDNLYQFSLSLEEIQP